MGWEKMWDNERKKWVDVFFEDFKTVPKVGTASSNVGGTVVLYGPDGRPLVSKTPRRIGFQK